MNNQLFDTTNTYRDEFGRVHDHVQETSYAGTSGWIGSDGSRDRAVNADTTGVTGRRQTVTLDLLNDADTRGLTWKELAEVNEWHHVTASGALSVLHKTGNIARLKQKRNGCHVYVLPRHVLGRDTEPHGRTSPTDRVQELLDLLLTHDLPIESRVAIAAFKAESR